jgi:hypothetical protein
MSSIQVVGHVCFDITPQLGSTRSMGRDFAVDGVRSA